jgi:hypothetical protein
MELDRALEFAVVSSWDELAKPGESCSLHVEYVNVSGLPLDSVEVWMIANRGYGKLVCNYSMSRADSPETLRMHFANSYRSNALTANLDFIMRNQQQFSRLPDRSIHGLVQVDPPSDEERKLAASWSSSVLTPSLQEPVAEPLQEAAARV